ncbi:MAG: ROK family protein [Candidatus Aminicenantes bacterium]
MDNRQVKKYCIGMDVGGTKISAALFTPEGKISSRIKNPIDTSHPEKINSQIVNIVKDLESVVKKSAGDIKAIGIAIPGIVYNASGKVWAPNIPGWDHYPLRDNLQRELTLPLVLDSDRSAYVLGEQWCGNAKGLKDVVFLAVGTGIGAGIIVDGVLCRGSEDIAGAVGWFALDPIFREEYAEMGCFEAEASGNSVARKAIQLIREGEPSSISDLVKGNLDDITAETVAEAARRNDVLAKKVIDSTIKYLSMGIANIVSILNPRMIVLGGGLFQAGDLFLDPIRTEFRRWAQPIAAKNVKIELSSLGEDAGLYGAGKLAWYTD